MNSTAHPPIRLLVIDDEPGVRRGLILRCEAEADLHVVGTACDGDAGVRLAKQLRPDVVVVDARMPATDGFAATRRLCADLPGVPVVMLSLYDDAATRAAATAAGAAAFVSKHDGDSALLHALRTCVAGDEDEEP